MNILFSVLSLVALIECGHGKAASSYLVRSNGVVCITFPCPSLDLVPIDPPGPTETVTDLDVSRVARSEQEKAALMKCVFSKGGLKVNGFVEVVPKAGPAGDARVFRVTRVLAS